MAVQLYETISGKKVTVAETPFVDISGNANKDSVEKAYGLGIVVGISHNEFSPDREISREELATMICRTIKKYKFADWTFATDDEYYLDSEGIKKFADDADISDYAKPSVYYMAKMEIIKGVDDTHFAPKNVTDSQKAKGYATATREQALAISLRVFKISDMWK